MAQLTAPSPFSLILFGASGHLAQNKIYPALYTLALKDRLPAQFSIVGYARTPMTDDAFRAFVGDAITRDHGEVNAGKLRDFLSHVHYHAGQYTDVQDFASLSAKLDALEAAYGGGSPVRLAYLSIPPSVFPNVLDNLCAGGVHRKGAPFRSIIEKPVGHDLASFEEIATKLSSCFAQEEIYLLDHYLGKEAVRNIYYLRLANPVLERVLKNTLIHHVQITALESAGIEGRAGYFEQSGTFRDFFQSHLLMMVSLLTMRLHDDDAVAEGRYDALQQIYLPPASTLSEIVLAGQYGPGTVDGHPAAGYLEEENVAPASRANTYCTLKLLSRTSRWQGVPFYLRSGKRLERKETKIVIHFQTPRNVGPGSTPNRLEIILQGEAGMRWHLQTKMGGIVPQWRPLVMDDPLVCVGDCLPEHALLLLEAIHGHQQWFLTFDEIRTAWRLVDPLQSYLDQPTTPLHLYPAGSTGPTAADAWMTRDGVAWF